MAKKATITPAATPAATPAVSAATIQAAKQARFAPLAAVQPGMVLSSMVPNPHASSTKSHRKYGLFTVGATVAQIQQAFVQAGYPKAKATSQLRWALRSGHITLQG
jgi:hypothetical protein